LNKSDEHLITPSSNVPLHGIRQYYIWHLSTEQNASILVAASFVGSLRYIINVFVFMSIYQIKNRINTIHVLYHTYTYGEPKYITRIFQ